MALVLEEQIKKKSKFDISFEEIPITGHEKVLKVTSKKARLTAIIAIHNTTLGSALGGTRIQPYPTFEAALNDVLRLSAGMTYKSAAVKAGWGGGKSVIIADPANEKTDDLLMAFGEAITLLEGRYICAEDMGCGTEDVKIISRTTPYIVGLPHKKSSGNPSPYTAWGVFCSIEAALMKLIGSASVKNKIVAIQGTGSVGETLAEFLFRRGARLIVSDIDPRRARIVAERFGARICSPREILTVECDIFSPCALGGILNSETIPMLQAKAVVGAANNQLLRKEDADLLQKRGILYVPDFVANAGGLINATNELRKDGYDETSALELIGQIYDQLLFIFDNAEKNGYSPHKAAVKLCEYNLNYGIGRREGKIYFHHSNVSIDAPTPELTHHGRSK